MEKNIVILLSVFLASLICTSTLIPQILKIFQKRSIYDNPGGRKLHKNKTPSMGGVAIFFGFFLISIFTVNSGNFENSNYYFFALTVLFFTGFRDDLLPLASRVKLIIQIIAAAIVAVLIPIKLESLYSLNFLFNIDFPEWLSYFITIFAIVGITNAFNLIDGIDGLAGSIALIILISLTTWFECNNHFTYALLCVSMLGAIVGFLFFNWHPAKIFMGDTGSLIIGFFLATISIIFLNLNENLDFTSAFKIENSFSFLLTLFIYPIFDLSRIMLIRLKNKKSVFSPDKLHIHLLLSRIGLRHDQIVLVIVGFSFVTVLMFWILSYFKCNDLIIIGIIGLCCLTFNKILSDRVKKFKREKRFFDSKKIITKKVSP